LATYTSVLGLKVNDASDPFLLSDFAANWGLLDASPGIFICTSTTRPNWATAQAGRFIFMTDTKQTSYWDGAAWQDLRNSHPVFAAGNFVNTSMNPGGSPQFNILTFTTPRTSSLALLLTASYTYPNNQSQDFWQSITFDGVKQQMGSFREQIRVVGDKNDSNHSAGTNATSLAIIPSVAPGQHQVGIEVDISSTYKTAITLVGAKAMAFVSLYNAGNVL
jgi:hypothetical protein